MPDSSSHADSALFAYCTPHRKQLFIEFTTENKKQSLTQAESPATSSMCTSLCYKDL